jgi:hypothetical protein
MGPGRPLLALISFLYLVDPMLCFLLKLLLNIWLVVYSTRESARADIPTQVSPGTCKSVERVGGLYRMLRGRGVGLCWCRSGREGWLGCRRRLAVGCLLSVGSRLNGWCSSGGVGLSVGSVTGLADGRVAWPDWSCVSVGRCGRAVWLHWV